jgi:hypothetical protein
MALSLSLSGEIDVLQYEGHIIDKVVFYPHYQGSAKKGNPTTILETILEG